jgi:hypothetical protein
VDKDCADLDRILDTVILKEFLNDRSNLEWKVHILGNAIGHYFERAIRRNESNTSVPIESAKSDALMELDVIDLNCLLLAITTFFFFVALSHKKLII